MVSQRHPWEIKAKQVRPVSQFQVYTQQPPNVPSVLRDPKENQAKLDHPDPRDQKAHPVVPESQAMLAVPEQLDPLEEPAKEAKEEKQERRDQLEVTRKTARKVDPDPQERLANLVPAVLPARKARTQVPAKKDQVVRLVQQENRATMERRVQPVPKDLQEVRAPMPNIARVPRRRRLTRQPKKTEQFESGSKMWNVFIYNSAFFQH